MGYIFVTRGSKLSILQDGNSRLTDFGSSVTFQEVQFLKIHGRIGYLAPELLRKPPPALAPEHDVFGFAVLGWEIFARRSPNSSNRRINADRLKRLQGCPEDYQSLYMACGS